MSPPFPWMPTCSTSEEVKSCCLLLEVVKGHSFRWGRPISVEEGWQSRDADAARLELCAQVLCAWSFVSHVEARWQNGRARRKGVPSPCASIHPCQSQKSWSACASNLDSYEGNALEDPWDAPLKDMYTRSVSIEEVRELELSRHAALAVNVCGGREGACQLWSAGLIIVLGFRNCFCSQQALHMLLQPAGPAIAGQEKEGMRFGAQQQQHQQQQVCSCNRQVLQS
eukprot:1161518-Pelagomonas_calceolata.AAC.13